MRLGGRLFSMKVWTHHHRGKGIWWQMVVPILGDTQRYSGCVDEVMFNHRCENPKMYIRNIYEEGFSFFFWRSSPQWTRFSSFTRFLDHTQRRTTVDRTLLDERSAHRRDLYLTTHNTQQTDIHAPGGIRTHNFCRRAAADLRLRMGKEYCRKKISHPEDAFNVFPRNVWTFNRLTPNDPYMGRTAPLTSKRCILYIYSTNVGTEYFKHALYSPFFLFKMQFVS